MNIINYLKKKDYIEEIIIHDFKEFSYGYYFKIQCIFLNKFECHIKEYVDEATRNYSYHLQNAQSQLIIRWDNAPHYKNLKTFPHHIHFENEIIDSYDIKFEEIFERIEQILFDYK